MKQHDCDERTARYKRHKNNYYHDIVASNNNIAVANIYIICNAKVEMCVDTNIDWDISVLFSLSSCDLYPM